MANEYKIATVNVEVLRSPRIADAKIASVHVEVLRSPRVSVLQIAALHVEVLRGGNFFGGVIPKRAAQIIG